MDAKDTAAVAALAAQVHELGLTCARLSRENAELRGQVSRLSGQMPPPARARNQPAGPAGGTVSRRKAIGVAVAGVVGAAALAELATSPAAASDGDPVAAGQVTTGEARTSVLYDGSASFNGVVLLGNDSSHDGSDAAFPAGVGGWAGAGSTAGKGGVANGVYGMTDNGGGNGVVGHNTNLTAGSGAGVLGVAASTGGVAVRGTNSLGTAVAGNSGDTTVNATAVLGTITSTSPGGFSAAVKGQNDSTNGRGIGVWGNHNGSGWGLYGTSSNGIGVNAVCDQGTGLAAAGGTAVIASGDSLGVVASGGNAVVAEGLGTSGIGVNATADSSSPAVLAANASTGSGLRATSQLGRGGIFAGGAAQIKLLPGSRSTHPSSGQRGDLYADSKGRLWFCKTGGTTAAWQQIA